MDDLQGVVVLTAGIQLSHERDVVVVHVVLGEVESERLRERPY